MSFGQNSTFGFGSKTGGGGGTLTGANNGVSLVGTNVVFGQSVADVSNPAVLLSNREIPCGLFNVLFNSSFGEMVVGRDPANYSNSTFFGIRSLQVTGSTGVLNIKGYDSFRQVMVMQSPAVTENGQVVMTIKGGGALGGAMGMGVSFIANQPEFLTLFSNLAASLVRIYNTDNAGPGTAPLRVAIGRGSSGNVSAMLSVDSTTQGFLPPRLTTAQRDAIVNPAEGLQLYNTSTKKYNFYNGTVWEEITSA